MVSSKIVGIIAIPDPLIATICENQPLKLQKFWFTALHSSVFGKGRELVGEIKYTFAKAIPYYENDMDMVSLQRNMNVWNQIIVDLEQRSITIKREMNTVAVSIVAVVNTKL